jgi:hypothetical protein
VSYHVPANATVLAHVAFVLFVVLGDLVVLRGPSNTHQNN